MALFGDRPLFGPSGPAAPAAPSPTAQVAEKTGATASSPFLQYLQANAPAAKQTAQALLGDKPEADYGNAWLQAGLSMMSQPGGQSLLQALGNAGQTAMPLVQQEKQRLQQYDDKVNQLAASLGMSAAEFDMKMKDRKGLKQFGNDVIDEGTYEEVLRATDDPIKAYEQAKIIDGARAVEENAASLSRLRRRLQTMKADPNVDPAEIQEVQDTIQAMEWQIKPEPPTSSGWVMGPDGTVMSISGPGTSVAEGVIALNNKNDAAAIKNSQAATDEVLFFSSNILDILDRAPVAPSGGIASLAGDVSGWSKVITQAMSADKRQQFQEEVASDPRKYIEKLRNDREAANYLGDDTIDKLSKLAQENARLASNVIGLGYATAKAQEEGGRLATSDVAFALSSSGFDLEAWVQDPEVIRAGVMELTKRNLANHERELLLNARGDRSIVDRDFVLKERVPQYGFKWSGGPRGELVYDPQRDDETSADDVSTTQPQPATLQPTPPEPPEPPADMPRPKSKAEMDQLPSGTRFVAPDGSIRVKP